MFIMIKLAFIMILGFLIITWILQKYYPSVWKICVDNGGIYNVTNNICEN
jgi:hypothetical protein